MLYYYYKLLRKGKEGEIQMPITLKKRDNESNERLIRRFSRRIQTSGMLLRAKKRQYFAEIKNKNRLKKDALRRLKMRVHDEYLRKIGLLEEDTFGNNRNNRNNKKKR